MVPSVAFGVDDPAGTWSAKLFPFADVRTLIQANLTQATIAGGTITADAPLIDGSQTWNNAAVVLAANALTGNGPTAGLFRGEHLPTGLTAAELIAAGAEIEAERAERSTRPGAIGD